MDKSIYFKAFALSGRMGCIAIIPRALPWARSFCPFRAYGVPADLQSGETPSGLPHVRKFCPLLLRDNLEDFG